MYNPNIEESKSSLDSFELPCGYLDKEGNLYKDVVVREMTGEEEEILAAKNMPATKKINKILGRCVESIGPIKGKNVDDAVMDLPQGDRIYLLIAIRRASLGDDMPFKTVCPSCENEQMLTVDLSELESKPMDDPTVRVRDVTLPKSGKKVTMSVLTGRGEEAISRASNRGKDMVTTAIYCRVESIDDQPVKMNDLKKLPLQDRNFLREQWEESEGGIDTGVDITCSGCDLEYTTDIDISQIGFFNPLAAERNWRKKYSS